MSRIVLFLFAAFTAACKAQSPLEPSDVVPLDRIELRLGPPQAGSAVELQNGVPTFFSVTSAIGTTITVYALNQDGVYQVVTNQATLSSNNPAVARVAAAGRVDLPAGLGQATLTATYQGKTSSLTIASTPSARPPSVGANLASFTVGDELLLFPFVENAGGSAMGLTPAQVQWTSSDPAILSVSGTTLRANAPGVADLTLRYTGLQAVYRVSVPPYSRLGRLR